MKVSLRVGALIAMCMSRPAADASENACVLY
jgi:hypothetical protein